MAAAARSWRLNVQAGNSSASISSGNMLRSLRSASNTAFTEHITVINPGQPVRLRTDFPDNPKSRRLYFRGRSRNGSDAAVFEFILSQTVNSAGQRAAAELSHNQIAAATQLSRSTVIRSVKRLADLNLIETLKNAEWHRGIANRIAVGSSLLVPIEALPSVTRATNGRKHDTRPRSAAEGR